MPDDLAAGAELRRLAETLTAIQHRVQNTLADVLERQATALHMATEATVIANQALTEARVLARQLAHLLPADAGAEPAQGAQPAEGDLDKPGDPARILPFDAPQTGDRPAGQENGQRPDSDPRSVRPPE